MPVEVTPPARTLWTALMDAAGTAPLCDPALMPRSYALLVLLAVLPALTRIWILDA